MALVLALGLAAACGTEPPAAATGSPRTIGSPHTIYVFNNGWHSAVVVARGDRPAALPPESADFPGAEFLEFGWGHRDFFTAPEPTAGMALAAAFGIGPAALFVAGLSRPPHEFYPEGQTAAVAVTGEGLERLLAAVDASFERGGAPRAAMLPVEGEGPGRFYPARGEFSLLNTCNTWVARALAAGGVALEPEGVITAAQLMGRLRKLPEAAGRSPTSGR